MRVPIFRQDLITGSGFKRLAKRVQHDWPGAESISLSRAQDILARCLGYTSFHDVSKSADLHPAHTDYPPLGDVTINCIETISSELMSDGRTKAFNLGELQANIYRWPFLLLSVYRKHYGHSDNDKVGRAIQADHVKAFLRTQMPEHEVELQSLRFEAHLDKVQAQLGHENQLSTNSYINFPIGECPNSPPLKDNTALTKHIECSSCGPYVFPGKLEQ